MRFGAVFRYCESYGAVPVVDLNAFILFFVGAATQVVGDTMTRPFEGVLL